MYNASAIVCNPVFAVGKFGHRDVEGKLVFPYPYEQKNYSFISDRRLGNYFFVYASKSAPRQALVGWNIVSETLVSL